MDAMVSEMSDDADMLLENSCSETFLQECASDSLQHGRRDTKADVVAQIEAIFEAVADALLNERAEISVSLTACSSLNGSGHRTPSSRAGRVSKTVITFPGKSSDDAWRFSVVLRLLEFIHECVCAGVTLTKRDIFYRDPALFGKQLTVDRYVDYIASAFAVPRSSLNVVAGAKGLMAGAAVIHKRDGSQIGISSVQSGILVPVMDDVLSIELSRVKWILVIEKEATFHSVISSKSWEEMQWYAIIITGKGYPDIATRAMIQFMTVATPRNGFAQPEAYGLMDYDPDGMAILHTYKHGSYSLSESNDSLVAPMIRWLGLRSRDITDEDRTHKNQGLMPLTRRDRHKARKMLDWDRVVGCEEATLWRRELQVMLLLNFKAEIQILDDDGLNIMITNAVYHA